jgi:hypothetical protein
MFLPLEVEVDPGSVGRGGYGSDKVRRNLIVVEVEVRAAVYGECELARDDEAVTSGFESR